MAAEGAGLPAFRQDPGLFGQPIRLLAGWIPYAIKMPEQISEINLSSQAG